MKQKLLITMLCLALVLPVYTAGAQEEEQKTTQESAGQQQSQQKSQGTAQGTAQKSTGQSQVAQAKNTATGWLNKIIAFVSKIGGMFGDKLGFRIGGTTGTAIVALLIAKFAEDKLPSWAKWLLYATGGTMIAGSGANITQLAMQVLGG